MTQDFTKFEWQTSISLFNQTRRDCPLSFAYWSLACNSLNCCSCWREGSHLFVYPVMIPFHWNIFSFFVSPWYNRHGWLGVKNQFFILFCSDPIDTRKKHFNVDSLKVIVQRGFFGYHLQLFERDTYCL